jgi:pimeloyl-ACP methyl ester carboxylesterase
MGKLKDRPKWYAPLLEFIFRQRREGGGVLSPGTFGPRGNGQSRTSCLVLVHGFNNNDGEAAIAYDGFRERLLEENPAMSVSDLNRRFGDTFWPGDADWGFFDFVDFGVYSNAVGHARRTAAGLRLELLSMPSLLEADFIGHSLGCRLILETLELFRQNDDGPRIRRVCLMAAAVPMEMLEPGGRYHTLLAKLTADGTRVLILHSRQDVVLHFAFGLGQAMAGPDERSSRPLGRDGPNPLMPGYRANIDEMEMAGAAHGDYWGHSGKDIARESARQAGRFLGIAPARREIVHERATGFSEPGYGWRVGFGGE